MAIQKGTVGGRERENIKQVTNTADVTGFPRLKVNKASVRMPKIKMTRVRTKDRHPKKRTDAKTNGIRA
jgi:hypothetical protein